MTLTVERVRAAYDAMGSGDRDRMLEFWHPDVRWETPGHHPFSGWHEGLDAFLAFNAIVAEASAGTFQAEIYAILVNDEAGFSSDASRTTARRAHAPENSRSPYDWLEVEGIHLLRWQDGRIVEGRGTMLGDGIVNFEQWWSPVNPDGTRTPADAGDLVRTAR
jgi:ketosteroid isomerase-like protein